MASAAAVPPGGAPGEVARALRDAVPHECAFDPAVRALFGALAQQTALALGRPRAEQEAARAVEASQAKGVFLATMSHELRTPLSAVGGYAQLVDMGLHGPVTEAQREVWADREKLGRASDSPNVLPSDVPNGAGAAPDAVVFLRVRDTGRGIPRDQQDRIVEPFVQVHPPGAGSTYARAVEGTGLGLAISRDLARGTGGDLRVRSAPGAGSTFTVTLRRAVAAHGRAADRRTREDRRVMQRRTAADRRADAFAADGAIAGGATVEGDA